MASTSETGHAINAANLEEIIIICSAYGGSYNPSKAALQIAALQTLHTNSLGAISLVSTSSSAFINSTNERFEEYTPLKALCTRIINALDSSDASKELVRDTKTINRRIQGAKTKKEINDADPENPIILSSAVISTSQQSYDKLLDNFRQLTDLVSSSPAYSPNEMDLQVSSLNSLANTLASRNTGIISTHTALSNARIQRDDVLYNPQSGLVTIAAEVKKYIKALYGASSPQFKQISGIKFTRPKKK